MISSEFCIGYSSLPLLAFAIHNGQHMPAAVLESCGIDAPTRLREEDPFTNGFAQCFPNHIVLNTSRFAIDLNRSPEKCVYQKPEDAWGLPVRNAELSPELLLEMQEAYKEWYQLAFYQIDRLLMQHKHLVVLDLHSYNHRRGGIKAQPDPQLENPDIIIGRNNLPESRYPTIEKLRLRLDESLLGDMELDCRCDVKFPGGYFSRWVNHNFGDKVLCLAIEFKKIFMNEWTGELDIPVYEKLKGTFHNAVMQWMKEL